MPGPVATLIPATRGEGRPVTDAGISFLDILIAILAPGFVVGAVVGGTGWFLFVGRHWWLGVVLGAIAGTAIWYAWLRLI